MSTSRLAFWWYVSGRMVQSRPMSDAVPNPDSLHARDCEESSHMKPAAAYMALIASAFLAFACHSARESADAGDTSAPAASSVVADKPFVAAGKINLELDGGFYVVRTTADNHIRVALTGNAGARRLISRQTRRPRPCR